MEWKKGVFTISDDTSRLDLQTIHSFLTTAYWCGGIPEAVVRKALQRSLCFGVYTTENNAEQQVGFGRAITDRATFAYLADVFIVKEYRGRGLAQWLIECVLKHPDLQGLRQILLATADAHGLYERFGFKTPEDPKRFMMLLDPDIYQKTAYNPSFP